MKFIMEFKNHIFIICFLLFKTERIKSWSYNPTCWLGECCNLDDIPTNIHGNFIFQVSKYSYIPRYLLDFYRCNLKTRTKKQRKSEI